MTEPLKADAGGAGPGRARITKGAATAAASSASPACRPAVSAGISRRKRMYTTAATSAPLIALPQLLVPLAAQALGR